MRGTLFAGFGLVGLGVLGGVVQFPASLRQNLFDASFGDAAVSDIVPFAFLQLLPILGALIVLGVGGLALAKGAPQVSAGDGARDARLAADPRRRCWPTRIYHVGDAQLGGTVFEEGVRLYVGYGAVARRARRRRLLGSEAVGPDHRRQGRSSRSGCSASSPPRSPPCPYLVAGFAKQPADAVVFDYGGPMTLWNVLALVGHALMLLTILGFIGLAVGAFTSDDDDRRAGDDPWDGQTLEWATSSPAPADNFADVPVVASPEPLARPEAGSREDRLMIALHAGPAPAPRRQLFVGTALAGAGIITLFGGMLATWMRMRTQRPGRHRRVVAAQDHRPRGRRPTSSSSPSCRWCIFAQWAVYAARRDDRANAGLALGLTGLMGLAVINGMVFAFNQIKLPARRRGVQLDVLRDHRHVHRCSS